MRYLLKNKSFTAINLFGLTVGFLSFLLISLYIHDELNFDSFHSDSERIYRVIQHQTMEDATIRNVAQVAARIGPAAADEFPEVAGAFRISVYGRITMGNDPESRDNQRIMCADENFFSLFNIPLREGDPSSALQPLYGVVLSEDLAKKYFGNEPAIGKQVWTELKHNDQPIHFVVTGVMDAFPKNSHLHLEMFISEATFRTIFDGYGKNEPTDWSSNQFVTYIKVQPGADIQKLEKKLTSLVSKNYPHDKKFQSTFSLQPIRDIHLYSHSIQERTEISTNLNNPLYLYLFGIVGLLILLIACLNYLNLLTAVAYQRTREIGTRKSLGAQRSQLISQFLGEGVILSVLSLILALAILQTVLPFVNLFIEKNLSVWALPMTWQAGLFAVTMLAGIGASLYPAFVIVRISPSLALKKDIKFGRHSLPVRKVLVASQFAISILMIASTIVIYRQLDYLETRDLGFKLEGLLVLDINSALLRDNAEKVKSEFRSVPEVQSIAASSRVPGEWKTFNYASVRNAGDSREHEMIYVGIDKDFLATYHIELAEGRNFSGDISDSLKVILTKKAVEQLGLVEPVGQIIDIPAERFGATISKLDKPLRVEVIGVSDNFHFESFKHEMMPLIFAWHNTEVARADYYTLSIKTSNWTETIDKLKAVNRKLDPNEPMEYNFLEDRFEDFYRTDEKRGQIFLAFSIEIVVIACLGLFALVSYSVESRTKEIGIRKVLGAAVSDILTIIAREFVVMILAATIIALPLAWFLTDNWLNDFAYRVSLGPGVFLLASFISILIAGATIGWRTVGAAMENPSKWLKSE